jgi:hypothetical protein
MSINKQEKEYKMCLDAYNEKSNEKATLVNRLMEVSIDVQMGRPARQGTDTAKHDTIRHGTTGHERVVVPCRANTPCRLLGPRTTRTSFSRVVPARRHGKHVVSCWAICTAGKKESINLSEVHISKISR